MATHVPCRDGLCRTKGRRLEQYCSGSGTCFQNFASQLFVGFGLKFAILVMKNQIVLNERVSKPSYYIKESVAAAEVLQKIYLPEIKGS